MEHSSVEWPVEPPVLLGPQEKQKHLDIATCTRTFTAWSSLSGHTWSPNVQLLVNRWKICNHLTEYYLLIKSTMYLRLENINRRKPDTKGHKRCDSIYMTCLNRRSREKVGEGVTEMETYFKHCAVSWRYWEYPTLCWLCILHLK